MKYNFVRINPNEGGVVAVETPDGRLPIRSFRDFYAFEQHVKAARARRGVDMIPDWYKIAVFYFSNSHSLLLDGEDLQFPSAGEWLDFELEVGAVIGRECRNVKAEDAEQYILGYTVINDWSLRDAQKAEMVMNLGPAKGKDFATTLGPVLVTPDELEAKRSGKGFDLQMTCHVNGREISRGNWNSIHFSFGEMIERASNGVTLYPGELIGSGTVGTGCILELGPENTGGWIKSGDVVDLEIEGLGKISNKVAGAAASAG